MLNIENNYQLDIHNFLTHQSIYLKQEYISIIVASMQPHQNLWDIKYTYRIKYDKEKKANSVYIRVIPSTSI